MRRMINRTLFWTGLSGILLCLTLIICDSWVSRRAHSALYTQIDQIPYRAVALVPGTSHRTSDGNHNLFFEYRMNAAAELFHAGKVSHILVSGDNHVENYNEPAQMRKALLERGVPDSVITLDYAGFRTFDSVIRCSEVFGQEQFTFVSQPFQNERALFIARSRKLDMIAFNAASVSAQWGLKTYVREYFARVQAVLDVYLLNTKPHFLGEKIPIKV